MNSLSQITKKYTDKIVADWYLTYKIELNLEERDRLEDWLTEYADQVLSEKNKLLDELVKDYEKKFEEFMFGE